MNLELKEYIKKWIIKAEHDLLNAKTIIEHEPIVLDTACFHCQQAAEKFLKAFLTYQNCDFGKTHNVIFLLNECAKFDVTFSKIDIKNLNDFAVDIRYPDDYLDPSMEETKEYFQIASSIQKIVMDKIKL